MKYKNLIIAAIVVLIIISILPFVIIFYRQPLSNNIQDWANAGSWFSLFISAITTIILIYLTWKIHKNEQKRETENRDLIEKLENPIVVFFSKPANDLDDIDKWFIKNIGKGPALNISITHFPLNGSDWVDTIIDCYSLGTQESPLQLMWLNKTKVNRLLVFYNDNMSNKIHASIAFGDKTQIIDFERLNNIYDDESNEIISKENLLLLLKSKHKRMKLAIEEAFPPGEISIKLALPC